MVFVLKGHEKHRLTQVFEEGTVHVTYPKIHGWGRPLFSIPKFVRCREEGGETSSATS